MNEKQLELARQKYLLNEKREELLEKINCELAVSKEDVNKENSKDIYMFLGYYNMYSYGILIPLYESNQYSRHICYANLETAEIITIDRNLKTKFEKENIVIYFDDPKQYHTFEFYQEKFTELRNEYFSHLANNTKEESIKQIIKTR